MLRPKSKAELLLQGNSKYKQLLHIMERQPKQKRNTTFPTTYLNRNICDVFAHLHHWHRLFLGWYVEAMKGNSTEMLAKGDTIKRETRNEKAIMITYMTKIISKNACLPTNRSK